MTDNDPKFIPTIRDGHVAEDLLREIDALRFEHPIGGPLQSAAWDVVSTIGDGLDALGNGLPHELAETGIPAIDGPLQVLGVGLQVGGILGKDNLGNHHMFQEVGRGIDQVVSPQLGPTVYEAISRSAPDVFTQKQMDAPADRSIQIDGNIWIKPQAENWLDKYFRTHPEDFGKDPYHPTTDAGVKGGVGIIDGIGRGEIHKGNIDNREFGQYEFGRPGGNDLPTSADARVDAQDAREAAKTGKAESSDGNVHREWDTQNSNGQNVHVTYDGDKEHDPYKNYPEKGNGDKSDEDPHKGDKGTQAPDEQGRDVNTGGPQLDERAMEAMRNNPPPTKQEDGGDGDGTGNKIVHLDSPPRGESGRPTPGHEGDGDGTGNGPIVIDPAILANHAPSATDRAFDDLGDGDGTGNPMKLETLESDLSHLGTLELGSTAGGSMLNTGFDDASTELLSAPASSVDLQSQSLAFADPVGAAAAYMAEAPSFETVATAPSHMDLSSVAQLNTQDFGGLQ